MSDYLDKGRKLGREYGLGGNAFDVFLHDWTDIAETVGYSSGLERASMIAHSFKARMQEIVDANQEDIKRYEAEGYTVPEETRVAITAWIKKYEAAESVALEIDKLRKKGDPYTSQRVITTMRNCFVVVLDGGEFSQIPSERPQVKVSSCQIEYVDVLAERFDVDSSELNTALGGVELPPQKVYSENNKELV